MVLSITQAGKQIRFGQLINRETGKAVTIAMDHGVVLGPIKGIEIIESAVKKVLLGKPNAVMMTLGAAKKCYRSFVGRDAPGLILRLDSSLWARQVVPFKETNPTAPLFSVEDAIKFGASAVIVTRLIGLVPEENERYNVDYIAEQVHECEKWGIPIIIETLIFGKRASKEPLEGSPVDLDALKMVCREVAEMGADIIKAPYAGSREAMEEVVKTSSTPILVLGGGKMENPEEILTLVKNSIDAGCMGCLVGRNVWQHEEPQKVIAALMKIVHENVSVKEALKILS